jgi:hypothetical protein
MIGLFLDKFEKMGQNPEEILSFWKPFSTTLLMSMVWHFAMRFCFYRYILPTWSKYEESITEIINGVDDPYVIRKQQINSLQGGFVNEVSSHCVGVAICLALGLQIFVVFWVTGRITNSVWNTLYETFIVCLCFTYLWFGSAGEKIAKDFAERQVASLFKRFTSDY